MRDQFVFNDQMDILKLIELSRQQSGIKSVYMSLNVFDTIKSNKLRKEPQDLEDSSLLNYKLSPTVYIFEWTGLLKRHYFTTRPHIFVKLDK